MSILTIIPSGTFAREVENSLKIDFTGFPTELIDKYSAMTDREIREVAESPSHSLVGGEERVLLYQIRYIFGLSLCNPLDNKRVDPTISRSSPSGPDNWRRFTGGFGGAENEDQDGDQDEE